MGAANKEFPLLAAEGLYVAETAGNGKLDVEILPQLPQCTTTSLAIANLGFLY